MKELRKQKLPGLEKETDINEFMIGYDSVDMLSSSNQQVNTTLEDDMSLDQTEQFQDDDNDQNF